MSTVFCLRALCSAVTALLALQAGVAHALEGDLDTSFGYYNDGTAYLPIEDRLPGQFADDHAVAILPQPDGSTIMVGNINRSSRHGPPTSYDNIGIAKLRPEGTYEYAFGNGGGWLILPGSDVAGNAIHANAAFQLIDGRVAIAGYQTLGGTRSMAVWMVTPDGALDPTFGTAGVLTIARGINGSIDEATAIRAPTIKDVAAATFTSGLIVAGTLQDSPAALSASAMFTLTASGALLAGSRGTHAIAAGPNAGARYTRMPIPAAFANCHSSVAAQAYRSLGTSLFVWYVVGNLQCPDGGRWLQTTRLGVLDQPIAGFGATGNGTAVTAFDAAAPARSKAADVSIDGFGRAAVVGSVLQGDQVTPANMAATLLNVAGVPDGNFNGGSRVLNWPTASASSGTRVLVQRNGRLLVTGSIVEGGNSLMAVTRLLPSGAVDPTWSSNVGRRYPFVIQSIASPAAATSASFAIGESLMIGGWVRDVRPAFTDVDFGAMRIQGDLIFANGWGIDDW